MKPRLLSGCDARYFRSLCQLLLSLERLGEQRRHEVQLFDLGMTSEQREFLQRRFPWASLEAYRPPHAHLGQLSNYGWKPTLIATEGLSRPEPLLWLDSACRLLAPLDPVWDHVRRCGVWCPHGGGAPLREIAPPLLGERLRISSVEYSLRIRAGGVCAFDPSDERVRALLETWAHWAAEPDLLLPKGYDQSLLTLALARSGLDPSADELDISSWRPTPFLASRNKVANWLPLWADPLARAYFRLYRELDVFWLRVKHRCNRHGRAGIRIPFQ